MKPSPRSALAGSVVFVANMFIPVFATHCLNAPTANLKKLTYKGLEYQFPLGHGIWNSPRPVAQIIYILLKEKLGIDVDLVGSLGGSTDILQRLIGCRDAESCNETRMSDELLDPPDVWAAAEVWQSTPEEMRLGEYAQSVGSVGYVSTPSLYTYARAFESARLLDLFLGFWETLKLTKATSVFSNVADLDRAIRDLPVSPHWFGMFFGCTDVECDSPGYILPGRDDGQETPQSVWDALAAEGIDVDNDGWYYSPTCRSIRNTCIPVVLGNRAWNFREWCLVAKENNLPLAITYLGWFGEQVAVNLLESANFTFLFYWWQPDDTFLQFNPQMMFFNEQILSIKQFQYTSKMVWVGLRDLDEDLYGFFSRFRLTNDDIYSIMQNYRSKDPLTLACGWLKANPKVWEPWLPDKTNCMHGFHYDVNKSECAACQTGTASNERGRTACDRCAPGRHAPNPGMVACDFCPPGRYASEEGHSLCNECAVGTYQSNSGMSDCLSCGPKEATLRLTVMSGQKQYILFPGAPSKSDCGCVPGTRLELGVCVDCCEGLDCRGKNEILIKHGYWSSIADPLNVFKCGSEENCAGGEPESCAGRRTGFLCARCPGFEKLVDSQCSQCEATDIFINIFYLLILYVCCPLVLYQIFNVPHRWKLLAQESMVLNLEVLVEIAQVVAVVAVSDLEWVGHAKELLRVFEVFSVDIGTLISFECMFSLNNDIQLYLPGSLLIPSLCFDIWAIYFLSQMLPSRFRMVKPFAFNLCGKVLNTLYVSQVQIGMIPFVCYPHPNGKDLSISAFEATQCYRDDWFAMAITGLFSLLISLLYFAYLCFEMRRAPHKLSGDGRERYMQSITFLIEDFRADVYYWNIPAKSQEIALALVFVAAAGDPLAQSIYLTYIFLMCLGGYVRAWPYKSPLLNLVVNLVFAVLIAVLVCADSRVGTPEEDAMSDLHITIGCFLCALSFALVVIIGLANIVVKGRDGELFSTVLLSRKPPDIAEIAKLWANMRKFDEQSMTEYLSDVQIYDVKAMERLIPLLSPFMEDEVIGSQERPSLQSLADKNLITRKSRQNCINMYTSDAINVPKIRTSHLAPPMTRTLRESHFSKASAVSDDDDEEPIYSGDILSL